WAVARGGRDTCRGCSEGVLGSGGNWDNRRQRQPLEWIDGNAWDHGYHHGQMAVAPCLVCVLTWARHGGTAPNTMVVRGKISIVVIDPPGFCAAVCRSRLRLLPSRAPVAPVAGPHPPAVLVLRPVQLYSIAFYFFARVVRASARLRLRNVPKRQGLAAAAARGSERPVVRPRAEPWQYRLLQQQQQQRCCRRARRIFVPHTKRSVSS
ncbi:unnamed protein product, partial [Scytosiphon promiscuus]